MARAAPSAGGALVTANMTTRPCVRRPISPDTVLQITGALGAVLVSGLFASPVEGSPLRDLLLSSALLILPVDVLPVIMIVTIRRPETIFGPLTAGDIVALVYLVRLTAGLGLLRLRITLSYVLLLLFLIWTVIATAMGFGVYTALGRVALYAAVGIAVTHRPRAKTYLLAGVVGFALVEVILYLPKFPARLWGDFVNDPSHAGALLIAALIVVGASHLSRTVKISMCGLLVFAILMTLTRSIWFATGVVVIAALLPRRWYVPLLLPPALGVVALPLVTAVTSTFSLNPASVGIRAKSISIGLHEFKNGLFFGHGWAFTSAVGEFGLVGINNIPVYNLWIYLGMCTGLFGIALFVSFIALLGKEAVNDTVAYLFLTASLATSLSEMHFYACSLTAILFFVLTSVRPDPGTGTPGSGTPNIPASVRDTMPTEGR
jgi:hypothetical protein